ncbi:MAG: DUF4124 domain-containing protein [Gammaproteobacteria bacterium]
MKTGFIILSLIIIFSSQASVAGKVFKWKDERGNIHFGDSPGVSGAEVVDIPKYYRDPFLEQRVEELQQALEDNRKERALKKEQEKVEKEERQIKEKNCLLAKDRLNNYQTRTRLYRENDQGIREYLSERERLSEIEKAEKSVADWCQ